MATSVMRVAALYLQRHAASIADGSVAEGLIRHLKEGQDLEQHVRALSGAVPCPEPHASAVKKLLRLARASRRTALETPPGQAHRAAMFEWLYLLALSFSTVQLPYSQQAMRGRWRVVKAGKERRRKEPRNAVARMKRMGKTRAEASEYLKNAFSDISPRQRTNILAEVYGQARQRSK
jgi:hypothetical protein